MRKAETIAQAGDYAPRKSSSPKSRRPRILPPSITPCSAGVLLGQARQGCGSRRDLFTDSTVNPKSVYLLDAAMAAGRRCFYRANNEGEATKWFKYVMDNNTPDASEAAHWTCRLLLRGKKPKEAADLAAAALPKAAGTTWAVHLDVDRADGLYENRRRKPTRWRLCESGDR